jgi:hypothetical protein
MSEPEPVRAGKPGRPAPGEKARWEILFGYLDTIEQGDVALYTRMGELLGLDYNQRPDRLAIAMAARKAIAQQLEQRRRVFNIVRGEGYMCAPPEQVLVAARRHQERAVVHIDSARTKVDAIDTTQLDSTMRRIVEATAMGFARQALIMHQLDVRQGNLETAVREISATQKTTVETVDDHAAQLAELQRQQAELAYKIKELGEQNPPAS